MALEGPAGPGTACLTVTLVSRSVSVSVWQCKCTVPPRIRVDVLLPLKNCPTYGHMTGPIMMLCPTITTSVDESTKPATSQWLLPCISKELEGSTAGQAETGREGRGCMPRQWSCSWSHGPSPTVPPTYIGQLDWNRLLEESQPVLHRMHLLHLRWCNC